MANKLKGEVMNHEKFMKYAIKLAQSGIGLTYPNPSVGCIIVNKNGIILSKGVTEKNCGKHAERIAIEKLKKKYKHNFDDLEDLTLYVTLEPCSHYGKNPPCINSIIVVKAINRVVIGTLDPFEKVNGNGVRALESHGIKVIKFILESESKNLIKGFKSRILSNRPYVTIKIASSLDGKIALSNFQSQWITSNKQKNAAHKLRRYHDAIMVGINTVLKDNPMLNCRYFKAYERKNFQPIRVILDTNLQIPLNSKIFQTALDIKTVVMTTQDSMEINQEKLKILRDNNIEVFAVKLRHDKKLNISEILNKLAEIGVNNLLIEGGGKVISSFLGEDLFDELIVMMTPTIMSSAGISWTGDIEIKTIEEAKKFSSKIKIVMP